ncbi:MAG: radical SAM protein [Desulfuromonas sp.]|nr:MAG: radical SAM protein [Desulfuromonas sp.]
MPVPAIPATELPLLEAFSSIQGEGLLVGCRQIFLRFATCNLSCAYCDTPFAPVSNCQIETGPGSGTMTEIDSPVALSTLLPRLTDWLTALPGGHHSISLTGGEPLLLADQLRDWLPQLRKLLPIYLETNGTLPAALEQVLPQIDWIALDFKMPSQTGLPPQWDVHRDFLDLARQKICFVKAVVGVDTTDEELIRAAELLQDVAPDVTLILQPVTVQGRVGVAAPQLLEMQGRVATIHPLVRIIPQTHHFLSML